ncbi:hypothetical protein LDC_0858 [sediment metagenome]|uniref:Uncharacterized protein n=1 Tax=sediment metagenome TaxID=749907 RepID=D9PH58_9ZZZZ
MLENNINKTFRGTISTIKRKCELTDICTIINEYDRRNTLKTRSPHGRFKIGDVVEVICNGYIVDTEEDGIIRRVLIPMK